jgi:hypothetical protein
MGAGVYNINTDNPSYQLVGLIGFFIYLPMFFYCLLRSIITFYEDGNNFLRSHKKLFHFMISLYYLFDTIYEAGTWWRGVYANQLGSVAYNFHLFALYWNLIAFCIVVHFWTYTLFPNSKSSSVIRYLVGFIGIVNLVVLFLVVGAGIHDPLSELSAISFEIYVGVNSFTLLLVSIVFLAILYQLQRRLISTISRTQHNSSADTLIQQNLKIVINIARVTLAIVVFYLARALVDAFILGESADPKLAEAETLGLLETNQFLWFFCTKWIVYIIPSFVMLHLMRPKVQGVNKTLRFINENLIKLPTFMIAGITEGIDSSVCDSTNPKPQVALNQLNTQTNRNSNMESVVFDHDKTYLETNVSVNLEGDDSMSIGGYERWSGCSANSLSFTSNPMSDDLSRSSSADSNHSLAL